MPGPPGLPCCFPQAARPLQTILKYPDFAGTLAGKRGLATLDGTAVVLAQPRNRMTPPQEQMR